MCRLFQRNLNLHLIIAQGKNVPLQILSGKCSCANQIKPASYWNTEKKKEKNY